MMNEIIRMDARKIVGLLEKGDLTPLELVDASEERILQTDDQINAIPTRCFERAREHAKRIMENGGGESGPGQLHGLPLAIKDLDDVAGVLTTQGSPIFKDHIPERSGYVVERLESNGGIVVGKSNTPEFGSGSTTFNEVFGTTVNPWDTSKTCGGSSGGAAAALAAGQVWMAQGTDFGGSVRIPASYCSVVGLRPSPGRVATGPDPLPFASLSVRGPMARTVGDTALMLDAMVGRHPSDPRAFPKPARPFTDAVDFPKSPKKIAFSANLGLAPVDAETVDICRKAALSFQTFGSLLTEDCPDFENAVDVFQTLRAVNYASRMAPLLEKYRDSLKQEVIWNIEKSFKLSSHDIASAERARGQLFHRVVSFFNDYDLLMTPTVVAPPFSKDLRYLEEVEGTKFDSYIGWLVMTFVITLTACPAISIPCGFTKDGLPVGLQIVGPSLNEADVLSAAALFETEHPQYFSTPVDPRPAVAKDEQK